MVSLRRTSTNRTDIEYNGLGNPVRLTERDASNTIVSTRTLLWCDGQVCEERDGMGTLVRRHLSHGIVDSIDGPLFVTRDHLGSVRQVGATSYEYDPYGRRTRLTGSSNYGIGFTGHYVHERTGLILAPYRVLDPDLGRWLSRDPLGFVDGPNAYAYVRNNPISGIDRSGLASDSVTRTIWEAIKRGNWAEAKALIEAAGVALTPQAKAAMEKAIQEGIRKATKARDLIRATLKRSPSYASELENETYGDLLKLTNKKAKAMCKLIQESKRLMETGGDHR